MSFELLLEAIVTRAVAKALASQAPAQPAGGFLSVADAAARAKVSAECIRGWIHTGKLKATRPGGRRYLVAEEELTKFLAAPRPLQLVDGGPADVDAAAEAMLLELGSRRKKR